MGLKLPKDVIDVMRTLESAGAKAYVVGGAVRDIVMGREPSDYDIATNLRPWEVVELFEGKGWKVIPKGIEYGVVSVLHPETRREIEIATFRREVYGIPGNRRSLTVIYTDNIEEDLARRDFTINALAMDLNGSIIDPYGGLEDIRKRVIRFVGNPDDRIREDPLRMLRAVRFAAQLGFTLPRETLEPIRRNAKWILSVSRERWGEEILKAAKKGRFSWFVTGLIATDLYKFILPELDELRSVFHDKRSHHRGESVLEHTIEVVARVDSLVEAGKVSGDDAVVLRLAALLHDIAKPSTASYTTVGSETRITFYGHEVESAKKAYEIIVYRWRLPSNLASKVSAVIKYHHVPYSIPQDRLKRVLEARYRDIAHLLALHAYADTGDTLFLKVADEIRKDLARAQPLLNGNDIMRIYSIPAGPAVGAAKKILYMVQLEAKAKTKDDVVREACRRNILCPGKETNIHKLLLSNPERAVEEAAKMLARRKYNIPPATVQL